MPCRRPPVRSGQQESRPYEEYIAQHRHFLTSCRGNKDNASSPKLWRQMMIGFTCAGIVGLVMLVVGTMFISEAVKKEQPIFVMLCVMGIVFGTIILVGTIILDRHLISRKWMACQGSDTAPTSQCFHTCSVIYSPSLDQIGPSEGSVVPPPTYEAAISIPLHPLSSEVESSHLVEPAVMVLPPKYEEVSKPLPSYSERQAGDNSMDTAETALNF
ncbi:hypothetical protein ElyMa_005762600 [Elysia marginata]|uniref:Transmembrane protein 174 n=1 Tax=Elysia marginata TaxID=1093978 RepID=A0AAV4FQ07_9GAST|nr:hypothetical protein ElyMa_005762600 [Elysia marginata]